MENKINEIQSKGVNWNGLSQIIEGQIYCDFQLPRDSMVLY